MVRALIALLVVCPAVALAQPTVPCPESGEWGGDKGAITTALLNGKISDVQAAIDQAKAARGSQVGCAIRNASDTTQIGGVWPEIYFYAPVDTTPPRGADILARWDTQRQRIEAEATGCPRVGRSLAADLLGALYVQRSGQATNLSSSVFDATVNMYLASQDVAANASNDGGRARGVFGMYSPSSSSDPCYDAQFGARISSICSGYPQLCITYDHGLFAGDTFNIADYIAASGIYEGHLAFDHGWIGVMLVEAALSTSDPARRAAYTDAAVAAGLWSANEPCMRNHNYTAKNLWVLASLYDYLGEARWRTAMLDRAERCIMPGVLMDANQDGLVDGMTNQPFSGLTPVAQRPGRMWDGHNARHRYLAINAYALVATYVALRDRGDTAEAARVRPYVISMLDNLAWVATDPARGIPASGRVQVSYALALGLYEIADPEGESHPAWEDALAAYWNQGLGPPSDEPQTNPVPTIGLLMLRAAGVGYQPPCARLGTCGGQADGGQGDAGQGDAGQADAGHADAGQGDGGPVIAPPKAKGCGCDASGSNGSFDLLLLVGGLGLASRRRRSARPPA